MKLLPALIVLTILLTAVLPRAEAQGAVSLELHGVSWHFGADVDYNERNLGAGAVYSWGVVGVSAGAYYNSYRRVTLYGSVTFRAPVSRYVSLGADVGAVTGYQNPVSLVAWAVATGHVTQRVSINARYLPAIKAATSAVAALSVQIALF